MRSWPAEKTAKLKRLHGEGLTFSQIAKRMGKTRNACIGKANRLGLPIRDFKTQVARGRKLASAA